MTEKKHNYFLRNAIILIIVFLLGCLAMYGVFHFYPNIVGTTVTKLEKDVTINDAGIADAVEKVYDSVVVVNTYVSGRAYASGTGFVYKIEGDKAYLLTNNHVISGADDVYVTFTDGAIVKTEVVGSDSYSDIAVLSVNKKYAKSVATIGNNEKTRLGDTTFAIGAPIDNAYSWSVTRGILSGKDRLIQVSNDNNETVVINVLQTDTAINSGNSGGPLANANGEVIGITSAKLANYNSGSIFGQSSQSSIEGMGFAIPIETALKYAEELIKGEKIARPYLGVYMIDVTNALYSRDYYSLIKEADVSKGVVVTKLEEKSPAILAGLKENDIIIKMDDNEISSIAYFKYYLYKHEVGDNMKLTVIRGNKEIDINVKLTAN